MNLMLRNLVEASVSGSEAVFLNSFGLLCLTPLSTIFQLLHSVSFIGGGNWSPQRKP
jgi:hypothetical protein